MSSSSYRPVTSTNTTAVSEAAAARSPADKLSDKVFALVWVTIAAATVHVTDTWSVLFHWQSTTAVVTLLQIVAVGCGVNTVLLLYLTWYLPQFKQLHSDAWAVYCPRVIPMLTTLSVAMGLLLTRAVWPVWSFLSPLILAVEGLGLLFALQFVPWL